MTIKKPMKVQKPAAGGSSGGAAIASRLRLDNDEGAKKKAAPGGPAVTSAFIAAMLALVAAGVLTYMLWKHWEFLMPA